MTTIKLSLVDEIDTETLAGAIARTNDADDVFELIINLDEFVCDVDFTKRLYAHLGDVLRACLESEESG